MFISAGAFFDIAKANTGHKTAFNRFGYDFLEVIVK